MNVNYIFSFVLLISLSVLVSIAYYSWKRDKLYVSLSLVPVIFYSFGYAFEILCIRIETVEFWIKIEYIGIPFLAVSFLMSILTFTGYKEYINKGILRLLFIIPIITLILNYTNDFHHLFYKKIYMNNQGLFPIVEIIQGPWYWVNIIYTYFLMALSFIVFSIAYVKSVSIIRKQILMIMIAYIIPLISDAIHLLKLVPFNIDLCPFALCFSGMLNSYAILKFKLLKITPIALEKVFSNMSDGVVILDYENNIVNFNNASKSIIPELNYMEAGDKKIDEAFKEYETVLKSIHSSCYDECIINIKNKDALKYYKMSISNISDYNGKVIGRILTFNDITEIKRHQEKLSKLNDFRDKLFTVVSHDIKSPLGVLLSLLELLEDEDDIYKEENKEIFYEIKLNVKNTYEMVENVLQWFRSKMDGVVYNNLSWKLSDIMKNSIMFLKQNAELKGINVFFEIPKDIFIYADRDMLGIVLRNLFSNAIKFTNKGGNINVFAHESEGIVTIAVSDSGIGIENERIEEIFSNSDFYTTFGTSGEKGTGIGLMICRELIEKNKGKIWAESNIGKGITFYFTMLSDKHNLND